MTRSDLCRAFSVGPATDKCPASVLVAARYGSGSRKVRVARMARRGGQSVSAVRVSGRLERRMTVAVNLRE